MVGGGVTIARDDEGNIIKYNYKVTSSLIMACFVVGSGGLLLGFDNGLTGGVEDMEAFLKQFFPEVLAQRINFRETNPYCQFDSSILELYTSAAYIGGIIGGPTASYTTKTRGRKWSVVIAGVFYLIGVILQCTASAKGQLILGRFFLGFGVGFATQVGPLFLSEMAPAQMRGAINMLYQWLTTLGILFAEIINYGTYHDRENGYRISLALQAWPAFIVIIGGILIPESPNSLIDRQLFEQGKRNLIKIRGVEDVDQEYNDICEAAQKGKNVHRPWVQLFKPQNAAQTTITIVIPILQQWTGINVIMFYAPQILTTLGLTTEESLKMAIVLGTVNFLSILPFFLFVDRVGRKKLFLYGGTQMFLAHIAFAIVMGKFFKAGFHSKQIRGVLIVLSSIFVNGYAWSWGPLPNLVPSEVLQLELRPAGLGLNTFCNFLFTFVVGQSFLSMFCALKYGTFIFFGVMVFIMTLFIMLFTIETKGLPLERVSQELDKHWFWGRINNRYTQNNGLELAYLDTEKLYSDMDSNGTQNLNNYKSRNLDSGDDGDIQSSNGQNFTNYSNQNKYQRLKQSNQDNG